jgi:short-subunit dehydrogenase
VSRVVLVTGASSGIGRATAHEAAKAGDHVVLVARGLATLTEAAEECRRLGAASARPCPVDIGDFAALQAVVADVTAELGPIDVVVNSAGLVAYGRFEDVPVDVFDAVIRTNTLGAANVARAVLPGMRERDAGTLVLVGSLIGHIAPPYMSAYAVSKWAVRGLARELRIENRDRRGVQISVVAPGGVDTPIYLQAANYLGQVGRPPFPVVTPERVARAAMRVIDRPRATVQVGLANGLIIAGFSLFPRLYDALVTPLFTVAATDLRHPADRGTGNVLGSVERGNRLRGGQGNPLVSTVGSVLTALTSARRSRSSTSSQGNGRRSRYGRGTS